MSVLTHFDMLFQYKAWADKEILSAIANVDTAAYKDKRHLMIRLMNHIYVVDQIFIANIQGIPHRYTALNTVETPPLEVLSDAFAISDNHYIEYLHSLVEQQLDEMINFKFVDGGKGAMSRKEMFSHVEHHGAYHRGAVGWLLSECEVTPPKDVLTLFLRDTYQAEQ